MAEKDFIDEEVYVKSDNPGHHGFYTTLKSRAPKDAVLISKEEKDKLVAAANKKADDNAEEKADDNAEEKADDNAEEKAPDSGAEKKAGKKK